MEEKNTQTTTATAPAEQNALTPSAKFTNSVMRHYGNCAGAIVMTEYQKQLVQGYFVAIDRALQTTEEERLRKNEANKDHKYDNDLPCTWKNVNLEKLALDVAHYSRMGLDMMQDNHLFPIPYKNNKKQMYDMTLMVGYNGIQYIAEKYALNVPTAVTIELVYSSDTFIPIKKMQGNRVESYEFTINNPFDRGTVIGGFGYIEFEDAARNQLIIMTKADIEKRKPRYASANFWGGKQKTWENGRQVETENAGWYEEMCLKTLKREVYSAKHIPRDPMKIDEEYRYMRVREAETAEAEARIEIEANANSVTIDTAPAAIPERPAEAPRAVQPAKPAQPAPITAPAPLPEEYPEQYEMPNF